MLQLTSKLNYKPL